MIAKYHITIIKDQAKRNGPNIPKLPPRMKFVQVVKYHQVVVKTQT